MVWETASVSARGSGWETVRARGWEFALVTEMETVLGLVLAMGRETVLGSVLGKEREMEWVLWLVWAKGKALV